MKNTVEGPITLSAEEWARAKRLNHHEVEVPFGYVRWQDLIPAAQILIDAVK